MTSHREPTVSRQRKAQLRNIARGVCVTCWKKPAAQGRNGKKAADCLDCLEKKREYARTRYRLANGIDPEAPVSKRGRPKNY